MQQETPPIPKSGDVIKAAVHAAGGHRAVAHAFGLKENATRLWVFRGTLPGHYVRRLSAMGGGVVSVEALLAAIERTEGGKVAA